MSGITLFVSKLTADHCDLLEEWFILELKESYPVTPNDYRPRWLVNVYHDAGSQMGKPGRWTVRAWISDNTFATESEYPLIGFDPANALKDISESYVACENTRRIANNATAVKRMVDRCAAEAAV